MSKVFVLFLILAGCAPEYSVQIKKAHEKTYYTCSYNTGFGWNTLRICDAPAECNDFCEEKRKVKP